MIYKFNTMNRLKRVVLAIALIAGLSISSKSQVVDDTFTPAQLVQQVFLGQGVNVFNITFQGDSLQQLGKFNGFGSTGIDSGIVISTGRALDIAQAGNAQASTPIQTANSIPFDQDMLTLLNSNPNSSTATANDGAILEFDFIPLGDSVRFDYIFGSEEYPEFVCSYNDAFGMFLSGPGIAGPYSNGARNIALIPGTTEDVSIYNLNGTNSTGTCAWIGNNSNLYVDNTAGAELVYDGYTAVLRAEAQVICGQTYHLKIAIADAGDRAFDSGVLLKARSLVSNQISLEALSPGGDSTLVEGCAAGAFKFFRPGLLNDTLEVAVTYTGTSTNGVDFALLPDTIVFLPDSNTVFIPVAPIADGILEGIETITATIIQATCDGTTFNTISQTFYIVPPDPIEVTVQDLLLCPGEGGTLTASTTGGFFPITYLWSTGQTTQTIEITSTTNNISVVVTNSCGTTSSNSVNLEVFTPPVVNLGPNISQCEGIVTLDAQNAGQSFLWNNASTSQTIETDTSGVFAVTVSDGNGCSNSDSINVIISSLSGELIASTNIVDVSDQIDVTFNLNITSAADSIVWDFGDGDTLHNSLSVNHFFATEGVYDVTATIYNNACTLILQTQIIVSNTTSSSLTSPSSFQFKLLENKFIEITNVKKQQNIAIHIYSIDGKLISSEIVTANQNSINLMPINENLNSGLYVLKVKSNNFELNKKFIVSNN